LSIYVLDAKTSTYLFTFSLSRIHLTTYLELFTYRLYSGGISGVRWSFNSSWFTSIYMSDATTFAKGPSTVDCEVLTGNDDLNIFFYLVIIHCQESNLSSKATDIDSFLFFFAILCVIVAHIRPVNIHYIYIPRCKDIIFAYASFIDKKCFSIGSWLPPVDLNILSV
jgi:hypothetical protein